MKQLNPELSLPLISAQGLSKRFPVGPQGFFGRAGDSHLAVNQVSLEIRAGEILGLVGESGSGKSTLGRLLLRLIEADAGSVQVNGQEMTSLRGRALLPYRRSAQIVFQNPLAALNPRQRIGASLQEVLRIHGVPRAAADRRIAESLARVGLEPDILGRLPRSFSGGQLQRIVIARALLVEPQFLVADEAVSSLDVSIQAQVLQLFAELKSSFGLAQLFISHDLRAVAFLADRVAVMHQGRIVESGAVEDVFGHPRHEYTRQLLSATGPLVEASPFPSPVPHWVFGEN